MPKKEANQEPKITNLPLPETDNPLVIDLPDGQKIVVGKLQPGSVIEVATWRGTGRPDSRTNRLMMGMNTGTPNPENKETTAQKPTAAKREKFDYKILKEKAYKVLKLVIDFSKKSAVAGKAWVQELRREKAKPTAAPIQNKPAAAQSADVDEWLAKIIEKSERRRELEIKKNQVDSKNSSKQKTARQIKAKQPKSSKKKNTR